MTTLVKYCKPQHNLLDRCHTIRIGTIEYYRDMDPSFLIADPTEGTETVKMTNQPMANASPEAAAFIKEQLGSGPYNSFQNFNFNLTFPNSYIWCCSQINKKSIDNHGKRFDDEYTSFYTIPNPGKFAEYIVSLLMTNISRNSFTDKTREIFDDLTIREMGEISIALFHREIFYVDEKVSKIDEGFFKAYAPEIPRELRPVFVKPMKHAEDHEYRFLFLFQHRRYGALPVRSDPVDLTVLPISSSS